MSGFGVGRMTCADSAAAVTFYFLSKENKPYAAGNTVSGHSFRQINLQSKGEKNTRARKRRGGWRSWG